MIFDAFFKALGQLGDRRFRAVVLKGIALTIALLAGLTIALTWGVGLFLPETVSLPLIGEVSWFDNVLGWATVVAMIVLSVVLMVPVAAAFTGIFLDDVANAVEDRHYPGLPKVPHLPVVDTLKDAMRLILVTIGINLVALVLLLFVGPFAPVMFWAVNGYLLGREYFQMAAMRREGLEGATRLRKRHMGKIWLAGTLMAMPLSIPFLNLLIPVLGAASFTHLYHRLAGQSTSA
ncbi:MAG: EI24 domain-containing protein [Maritimibacter sp.]